MFAYEFNYCSKHAQNLKIEAALYACSTGHCLQVGVDGKAKMDICPRQKCPQKQSLTQTCSPAASLTPRSAGER